MKKKKLIALILTMVLILSLGTVASALEVNDYIYLRIDLEGVEVTHTVLAYEDGPLYLQLDNNGLYWNRYNSEEDLGGPFTVFVQYKDENGETVERESEPMYLDDIEGIIVLDENGFHVESSYLFKSAETNYNDYNVNVTGEYVGGETEQVISADLSWGSMEFVYTPNVEWNPTTHTYDPVADQPGTWEPAENAGTYVLVKNHSNVHLSVGLEFVGNNELAIEGEFFVNYDTGEKVITGFNVSSAEGYSVEEAPFNIGFLRITGGEIPEDVAATEVVGIGYVTVTISILDIEE